MKYKTTQKAARATYTNIIALPYCAIHTLLTYEKPVSYTISRGDWGADIYKVGCVAIATGISPFGKIRPDNDLYRKYEEIAQKIMYDCHVPVKRQKIQFRELLEKFVSEAIGN